MEPIFNLKEGGGGGGEGGAWVRVPGGASL